MTHVPRPPSPRLAPIDPAGLIDPELADVLAKTSVFLDGAPLNIFSTLAHQPTLLKRFNALGGAFLAHGLLPAREREIVILRVGWNCRSVYEFGQHVLIGRAAGLADEEITALATTRAVGPWSADDEALIALADEICDDDCASDATFAALRNRWSDAELVELMCLVGFYRMVSGFLNTLGVAPEAGLPGWPDGSGLGRSPVSS
ncbi:MAG: carboxymuconolactone decarboxylase family protein [Actinobacteria bacterium]|nr:carboxymuconolactone decarboxylase family protein [Actinomycetota bacterium]